MKTYSEILMDKKMARMEQDLEALNEDKSLLDANTILLVLNGEPIWFDGCDLRKAIREAIKLRN
jgi:hypothetical protein